MNLRMVALRPLRVVWRRARTICSAYCPLSHGQSQTGHVSQRMPSIVALALAYGVLEEGLTTQSLFNPVWVLVNRGYDVLQDLTDRRNIADIRYGMNAADLANPQRIITGLSGCCGQMDIQTGHDGIYVAYRSSCVVLNPETGRMIADYHLPADDGKSAPLWGYINVVGDLLVGGASPFVESKSPASRAHA